MLPASPAVASRDKRTQAKATAWLRGAALACGLLAAIVWSGALAAGPIDDALSLVAQERYAEARELLEPLLEREPDTPGVRLLFGVLHAREGNFVAAIAVFESLRNDHPSMFEAHNNLAVLYAKLGRLDDARKALVAAVDLNPDAVVYANLGDVYMKLAERAYERAHALRVIDDPAPAESEEPVALSEPEATPVEPVAVETTKEDVQAPPTEPQQPEIPEEPEAVPAQALSEDCVHVGWFKDRASADEAAAWMRSRGAEEVEVGEEEQQVIKNYQVYLPPASSREAATAVARELGDKGVGDIWIIANGPQANGISLGVFRSKQNMTRRVAELETLGYSVTTTANMKSVTEYAVEARAGSDRSAFDDAWKAKFPEFAIRYADCANPT